MTSFLCQPFSYVNLSYVVGCSVIYERLGKSGKAFAESTKGHLATYGEAGLRTLALSYRKMEEAEYTEWNAIFLKAKTTVGADRDAMLDSASELIEKDLILVGATAVEDKLQAGVSRVSVYPMVDLVTQNLHHIHKSWVFSITELLISVFI